MPSLDVSDITLAPEFSDRFDVIRRAEAISQTGRSVTTQVTATAQGTIYSTGDNSLQRQADYQASKRTITVVTPYRLQMNSPGFQPDWILYRGNQYVVSNIEDFSAFGAGFVVAECSSILADDAPPQ